LQPVPASIPGRTLLAYLNGALLLAATASVVLNFRVRLAAMFTTLVLAIRIVLLHMPRVIAQPNARAHIAAGIAILLSVGAPRFRRIAHVAASLWALMTGLWVALRHVPRALAHMDTRPEWTSLFVAITLCGGSLLVRQTLARGGRR
jgi:hypothetical protein